VILDIKYDNYYLLKYYDLLNIKYINKDYKLFYNDSIKLLIETIYKIDFDNLKKYNIDYNFNINNNI